MAKSEHQPYGLDFKLILTGLNQALDLALVVVEINMFEDMFGSFMRMEVLINDSLGLLDKYPIIGEETLTYIYKNPKDEEKTQFFKVYAVSERKLVNSRSHGILLHAISWEGMRNSMEYVYKPFIQKKPNDIVDEVFNKYLKASTKALVTDPASNDHTKVSSGVNPLVLIHEMANEAKSAKFATLPNGPSSYVFFESFDFFFFVPCAWFFEKSKSYTFKLGVPMDQNQFEDGNAFPGETIRAMRFVNTFDNIEASHRGAYLNEVNSLDPILKRFKMHPIQEKNKYTFKYLRDFDQLKHLPLSSQKFLLGNDPYSPASAKKLYSTHRRMLNTQIEEDGENYPTISYLSGRVSGADQLNAPRKRHEFLAATLHEKYNLQTQSIEITTHGVAEIGTGEIVEILIPQPTQLAGEHKDYLYLYGQQNTFLVTAIRHVYQRATDAYYTVLRCSKESFGEAPSPRTFDNSPEG
jgi:hypothetical protein